jgi:hypothetical protein
LRGLSHSPSRLKPTVPCDDFYGIVDLTSIDFRTENAVYLTDHDALDEARRLGIPITPLSITSKPS